MLKGERAYINILLLKKHNAICVIYSTQRYLASLQPYKCGPCTVSHSNIREKAWIVPAEKGVKVNQAYQTFLPEF